MPIKSLILLLLVIFGGYFYITYMGGGDGNLIADMLISSEKDEKVVDIEFNGAIRYLGHFPEKTGDILQIKFRTITFSGEKHNYSVFDKLRLPRHVKKDYIDDIRYEGNVPGGPLLVVRFTRPVAFTVDEANGLRSLHISYELI